MEWSRLLSPKRQRTGRKHKEKNRTDLRSSFERTITELSGAPHFGGSRIKHRYSRLTGVTL